MSLQNEDQLQGTTQGGDKASQNIEAYMGTPTSLWLTDPLCPILSQGLQSLKLYIPFKPYGSHRDRPSVLPHAGFELTTPEVAA